MDDCLAGGGEAGALMRAIDWSTHSLGPVARWPQSLRTLVRAMLSSTFAMRVLWGREYIMLYNDGYRPVLGASKHPSAMGARTEDSFRELWPVVGPMFARVMEGESIGLDERLLPLDRNGYLEECYFTLSYSPIFQEDGSVGGVLGVVHEVTERVLSSRRLTALRELASAAAKATTAEAACVHAASTLERGSTDVPFCAFYLLDDANGAARTARTARLVATGGLPPNGSVTPESIDTTSNESTGWPIGRLANSHEPKIVDDVGARFGVIHAGAYPEAITNAMMIPLARPGAEQPYGFFVTGVNPRRALDDAYHAFFELAREHIVTAISNATALQDERRRAEGLAAIDREKTAFFNNVSHEFRTPLTLMLGPLSDAIASPEQALVGESLTAAHRNAQRLLRLVNSLLEFARIEAGRVQPTYEATELSELTRELAGAFRAIATRAGLRLEIECPSLGENVLVDREMWERIVLNLVSNAFKFTFEGSIRVSLARDGEEVVLRVADTGVGVPEAEVPRLFERFHRVEATRSRSHEGSGIGLALVHELAKLHGGTVSVASRLGVGTSFTVRIPVQTTPLQNDPAIAELRPVLPVAVAPFLEEAARWMGTSEAAGGEASLEGGPDSGPAPADGASILLAEDNADMRAYLKRILEKDFVVHVASDGRVALRKMEEQIPDLVLSDVMMPNLDGIGLLRAIRGDARLRGVPVILLSARAGEESQVEALDARADDYVTKPFSVPELRARVRTHIELGRLRTKIEVDRRVAVEAERARLHAFFAQAPVAICLFRGPEHVYELANSAYLELVGNVSVVGKPLAVALPETAPFVVPILDRVYATGEPFLGNEFHVPIERSGVVRELVVNFVYKALVDAEGRVEGIAVVASEVTDQVEARTVAEKLTEALTASNRELDQFAYVASHDLKAPLRGIANLSEWIEEGLTGKMDAETTQQMSLLRGRVHRLEALIDGILSYSRASRKRERIEAVDVTGLLREVRDLLAPGAEATIVVGDDMPVLEAERAPLQQVFLNLIGNGLKHAARPDARVTVTSVPDGDFHHFRVVDNGPGIAPEYHDRIWAMFATLRARDEVEGTGIGLSVVKKIVETRGGRVRVESAVGEGATFHVYWPRR